MRRRLIILALLVAGLAAGAAWWFTHRGGAAVELTLNGNVDLRQVALAFNGNDRIAAVLVEEGDRVTRGQVLAHLDTSRLEPQVAQAEAQVAAQRAAVERLRNGSRPEEIAQARANLESAKADALNARKQLERKKSLLDKNAGSQQDADTARAVADVAVARVEVNQKALDLAIAGPRSEDIAQAEAQLRGNEAQLAFLRRQLADAELKAPVDGIVRSRLMEPGEMASPQRPVFSLAVIDPKWVRAYVSETDLGKVRSGTQASVAVDSFPGRRFDGWVGFVSPVAEFTPKAVETAELRTSLVYEVRVFVKDPQNDLPLGMPATVHLPLTATGAALAGSPAAAPPAAATPPLPAKTPPPAAPTQ
jgi:HlyD family secretion protein